MLSIINDLLDIAKIESGKVEIHKEVVSVEDVFADVKNDLIYDAQQRELYLDFKLPESELLVLTDRQRLIQVLFNLVSNGLKYTETGGVTVEAQIGSLNDHIGVWISVSDTGIGIANEELSTVFEKFVQASSRTHGTPGTGLGLAITRELVNLLGGQLEVDSTLGKGSVFRFWLPRYTK
ncbi:sensor histidine kinase [Aurantivibrio plasticivorans]